MDLKKSTVLVATFNKHKLEEMNSFVKEFYPEIGITLRGVWDLVSCLPEENGSSFEENALIKARFIKSKFPDASVIADDSGLEVSCLGGEPGIRSSRYSLEGTDEANNKKLLSKMKQVGSLDRTARFNCTLAYIDRNGSESIYKGFCEGVILESPQGTAGFGYDPLFYVESLSKTFSQISLEEKNKISHRSRALCSWLNSLERLK